MKKLVSIATFAILLVSYAFPQGSSSLIKPIQLRINFVEQTPVLEWDSYEEVNTSYYIIERQNGSQPWEILSTVKAGGSTYGLKHYLFEDLEPDTSSVSNYRLTLVWMDGSRLSWTVFQDFTAVK